MMEKPWVLFWWFLNSLFVFSHSVAAAQAPQSSSSRIPRLSILEAADPEQVAQWLNVNRPTQADAKDAHHYFAQGKKAKRGGNWSLASKSFGESLIRYPTPQSLSEYANAETHMLSAVRGRTRSQDEHASRDMRHVLGYYRSAVVADSLIGTLKPNERYELKKSASCLQDYVELQKASADCVPLKNYGLRVR